MKRLLLFSVGVAGVLTLVFLGVRWALPAGAQVSGSQEAAVFYSPGEKRSADGSFCGSAGRDICNTKTEDPEVKSEFKFQVRMCADFRGDSCPPQEEGSRKVTRTRLYLAFDRNVLTISDSRVIHPAGDEGGPSAGDEGGPSIFEITSDEVLYGLKSLVSDIPITFTEGGSGVGGLYLAFTDSYQSEIIGADGTNVLLHGNVLYERAALYCVKGAVDRGRCSWDNAALPEVDSGDVSDGGGGDGGDGDGGDGGGGSVPPPPGDSPRRDVPRTAILSLSDGVREADGTLSVDVLLNTGNLPAQAVDAYLQYDDSVLAYERAACPIVGSAFSACVEPWGPIYVNGVESNILHFPEVKTGAEGVTGDEAVVARLIFSFVDTTRAGAINFLVLDEYLSRVVYLDEAGGGNEDILYAVRGGAYTALPRVGPSTPLNPFDVAREPASQCAIDFSWTYPESNVVPVDYFRVFRGISPAFLPVEQTVIPLPSDQVVSNPCEGRSGTVCESPLVQGVGTWRRHTFTDKGLEHGPTYYYQVQSVYGDRVSGAEPSSFFDTNGNDVWGVQTRSPVSVPPSPADASVVRQERGTEVLASWTYAEGLLADADGFSIERKEVGGELNNTEVFDFPKGAGGSFPAELSVNLGDGTYSFSFVDSGLSAETVYSYFFFAYRLLEGCGLNGQLLSDSPVRRDSVYVVPAAVSLFAQGVEEEGGMKVELDWSMQDESVVQLLDGFEVRRARLAPNEEISEGTFHVVSSFPVVAFETNDVNVFSFDDEGEASLPTLDAESAHVYRVYVYACSDGSRRCDASLRSYSEGRETVIPVTPVLDPDDVTFDFGLLLNLSEGEIGEETGGAIIVPWEHDGSLKTSFEVWRAVVDTFGGDPDFGDMAYRDDIVPTATSFEEDANDLVINKRHFYKIRACYGAAFRGCSWFSAVGDKVAATAPLDFRASLEIEEDADETRYALVSLSWDNTFPDAQNYILQWRRKGVGEWNDVWVPLGVPRDRDVDPRVAFPGSIPTTPHRIDLDGVYEYRVFARYGGAGLGCENPSSGGDTKCNAIEVDVSNAFSLGGWAWGSNTGWVQVDSKTPDGEGRVVTPDSTFGVYALGDGVLNGHAWGGVLCDEEETRICGYGWLSFEADDAAGCPPGFGPCTPRIDLAPRSPTRGFVSGWARFVGVEREGYSGAWPGWVNLRGAIDPGTTFENPYGVCLGSMGGSDGSVVARSGFESFDGDSDGPSGGECAGNGLDYVTPSLMGWGYGGDVAGWIRFGGLDGEGGLGEACLPDDPRCPWKIVDDPDVCTITDIVVAREKAGVYFGESVGVGALVFYDGVCSTEDKRVSWDVAENLEVLGTPYGSIVAINQFPGRGAMLWTAQYEAPSSFPEGSDPRDVRVRVASLADSDIVGEAVIRVERRPVVEGVCDVRGVSVAPFGGQQLQTVMGKPVWLVADVDASVSCTGELDWEVPQGGAYGSVEDVDSAVWYLAQYNTPVSGVSPTGRFPFTATVRVESVEDTTKNDSLNVEVLDDGVDSFACWISSVALDTALSSVSLMKRVGLTATVTAQDTSLCPAGAVLWGVDLGYGSVPAVGSGLGGFTTITNTYIAPLRAPVGEGLPFTATVTVTVPSPYCTAAPCTASADILVTDLMPGLSASCDISDPSAPRVSVRWWDVLPASELDGTRSPSFSIFRDDTPAFTSHAVRGTFIDSDRDVIEVGGVYTYRLEAYYTGRAGPQVTQRIASCQPPSFAPTNVEAFANGPETVYVNWKDNTVGDVANRSFAVQRVKLSPEVIDWTSAVGASPAQVNFQWRNRTETLPYHHTVRRNTVSGDFDAVTPLDREVGSFDPTRSGVVVPDGGQLIADQDSGLTEATTYYYEVKTCADLPDVSARFTQGGGSKELNTRPSGVCSAWSAERSATTPPIAPSGMSASAQASRQISISWTDNSPRSNSYVVERRRGSAGWSTVTFSCSSSGSTGGVSCSDTSVSPSSTYTYRVRYYALDPSGNRVYSNYSNENSATTPSEIVNVALTMTVCLSDDDCSGSRSGVGTLTASGNFGTRTCTGRCIPSVPRGGNITFSASPDPGYVFREYTGNCLGTTNPCTLPLSEDKFIFAKFDPIPPGGFLGPKEFYASVLDVFMNGVADVFEAGAGVIEHIVDPVRNALSRAASPSAFGGRQISNGARGDLLVGSFKSAFELLYDVFSLDVSAQVADFNYDDLFEGDGVETVTRVATSLYKDAGLEADALYAYRVQARLGDGAACVGGDTLCSGWSDVVIIKTLPASVSTDPDDFVSRPICTKNSFCDYGVQGIPQGSGEFAERECRVNADCRVKGRFEGGVGEQ